MVSVTIVSFRYNGNTYHCVDGYHYVDITARASIVYRHIVIPTSALYHLWFSCGVLVRQRSCNCVYGVVCACGAAVFKFMFRLGRPVCPYLTSPWQTNSRRTRLLVDDITRPAGGLAGNSNCTKHYMSICVADDIQIQPVRRTARSECISIGASCDVACVVMLLMTSILYLPSSVHCILVARTCCASSARCLPCGLWCPSCSLGVCEHGVQERRHRLTP